MNRMLSELCTSIAAKAHDLAHAGDREGVGEMQMAHALVKAERVLAVLSKVETTLQPGLFDDAADVEKNGDGKRRRTKARS
jgi:hypothetical protein